MRWKRCMRGRGRKNLEADLQVRRKAHVFERTAVCNGSDGRRSFVRSPLLEISTIFGARTRPRSAALVLPANSRVSFRLAAFDWDRRKEALGAPGDAGWQLCGKHMPDRRGLCGRSNEP